MLSKDGQLFSNQINEGSAAFGAILATYTTLIDLGLNRIANHLSIIANLDQEVTLRFDGISEIIIAVNETVVIDDFNHSGLIEVKRTSVASLSGTIKTRSW